MTVNENFSEKHNYLRMFRIYDYATPQRLAINKALLQRSSDGSNR